MEAGDPSMTEEGYPETEIEGLSWGDTPGEAWENLREYCRETVRKQYDGNHQRQEVVARMISRWEEAGKKRALPKILQWGLIVPVGERYVKAKEVVSDAGSYRVKVSPPTS